MRFSKYAFIAVFFISSLIPFYSFDFLPVIDAPLIEMIIGRIIAARVATYVASGAAGAVTGYTISKLNNATVSGFTQSLINKSRDIAADSIYRVASGSLNWNALNYIYNGVPFQHYLDSTVGAITEGFEKGGEFFAYVNGVLKKLDFLPSASSPYLYSTKDLPADITRVYAKNIVDAKNQCNSIAAYVVYFSAAYYCGQSPDAVIPKVFKGSVGCDSISITDIDTDKGLVNFICHRPTSYDYGLQEHFSFAQTNYQPPKDPDSNPTLLPNKPTDLIKPSLDKPVPVADLAGIINSLAQDAASLSDYDGVPFSPASPITEQEIKNAIAGNGTAAQPALANPTVNDVIAPAQTGGASSSIAADSPSSAGIPADTPAAGDDAQSKPDYSFPSTPQPFLETPPDGETILKPITALLPFLKDFQVNTRQTTCPIFSFDLIGTTVKIDQHCVFLAKWGSLITSLCTAYWVFAALRITLSA